MSIQPLEIANFTKGLVTDANPMSYPANASLSELNMLIKQDGSRSRRLGMDVESGYEMQTATITEISPNINYSSYKWENVAGVPDLTFVVIKIDSHVAIFSTANNALSQGGALHTLSVDSSSKTSFSSVDGILVIASGSKDLTSVSFNPDSLTFTNSSFRLLIRDTFGVEDILDGNNYREGRYIQKRPKSLNNAHKYNLRNQTFALPRLLGGLSYTGTPNETVKDCITAFREVSISTYPSNADSILDAFYPNTMSKLDPTTNRFNAKELIANPPGSMPAPRGYFIIDALDRGASRMTGIQELYDAKISLVEAYKPTSLPLDESPAGATVLAQFAGRMFYSGFTSVVTDGDGLSPRMGSYILFSKLIESAADLKVCYQVGDPTSKNYSELLDTDGGFVRLEGAYNIQGMIPIPSGLAIIAENGVWLLSGEDKGQFKATGYTTSKISSDGCDAIGSIIATGDGFMYWSNEGIYSAAPNQFGDLVVTNITKGVIQKHYEQIPALDRRYVIGVLDKTDRKVKWIYGNRLNSETECYELVYSLDFSAFTLNKIGRAYTGGIEDPGPASVTLCPVLLPTFTAVTETETVFVGGDTVYDGLDIVEINVLATMESVSETKYLTAFTYQGQEITYTFSSYSNTYHYDWETVNTGTTLDAPAHILTGWFGGGDYQRGKQLPYLTMHFYKTEDGFSAGVGDEWTVNNRSSCKIQSQWNWANHINSGKWGTKFQAYRLNRHWVPTDLSSGYDNGFYTVETRNKVRGQGKVLSLLLESEPGLHMDIIGWSMVFESKTYV